MAQVFEKSLRVQAHGFTRQSGFEGTAPQKCLNDVTNKYTMPDMLKKIAPLSSSQKNEAVNSVIGTKSLKIRYYGGSNSDVFRVAAGVAQVNDGNMSTLTCVFSFNNRAENFG